MTAADAAAADPDAAADERLWRPKPPVPLERLTIWLSPGGEPAVLRGSGLGLGPGPGDCVIASTTGSIDTADAPGGSRPTAPKDADAVLALIPARHGIVVDQASADPIVIPAAQVDQLRPRPIPHGTEPDAAFHLPPPHVVRYLAAIRRTAESAGAGRITATWTLFPSRPAATVDPANPARPTNSAAGSTTGSGANSATGSTGPAGAPALLLIVKPARNTDRAAALDAVYRAVQDLAPPETVRVIDAATLSRGQMFRTLSGQRLVEPPTPDPAADPDPYTFWGANGPGVDPRLSHPVDPATGKRSVTGRTPFNLALAMFGALVGAFVVGLPHRISMPSAAAVPVVAIGILIVAVFLGIALRDFFRREP